MGGRKMTACVRRTGHPDGSFGSVDRAMKALGLNGVRRDKGCPHDDPAKDGHRAGDLLNRDFTAPAPKRVWVTDSKYWECRALAPVLDGAGRDPSDFTGRRRGEGLWRAVAVVYSSDFTGRVEAERRRWLCQSPGE